MDTRRLSRRNRIILYVISVLIVLSMIISAIVSFSPSSSSNRSPVATVTAVP